METEKVLKLIDAGFSAEEIRAMMQPQEKPEEKPEDQKEKPEDQKEKPEDQKEKPEDQKEKPEEKSAAKQPESVNDIFMAELNKTLEAMNDTLKSIQSANIRHSKGQQPESPVDIASDILAEVIAPQKGKSK